MDIKELKEILKTIGELNLKEVHIETDGMKIIVKKSASEETNKENYVNIEINPKNNPEQKQIPKEVEEIQNNKTSGQKETEEIPTGDDIYVVKAQLIGTFYAQSAPGEPPYVQIGSKVKKGDVLCILEAMKLFNEIVSEYDGEVIKICVKNEEMVMPGQPLFVIKKF